MSIVSMENLQVLKKIELVDDSQKDTKMFRVTADLQYKEEWAMSNGEQFWDCSMVYESSQTG